MPKPTAEQQTRIIEELKKVIVEHPELTQQPMLELALQRTGLVGAIGVNSASASTYIRRSKGLPVGSPGRKPASAKAEDAMPSSQIRMGEELIRQGAKRMEEERTALQKRLLELDDLMAKHRKWL